MIPVRPLLVPGTVLVSAIALLAASTASSGSETLALAEASAAHDSIVDIVSVNATAIVSPGSAPPNHSGSSFVVEAAGTAAGEPLVDIVSQNPGTNVRRDLCLRIAVGDAADYECGDLRVAHALPTVTTMGKARTPVLTYNSQLAKPYPIVRARVTRPSGATQPERTTAILRVGGAIVDSATWAGSGWGPGETRQIALGFDASSGIVWNPRWPTGLYPYTLEVSFWNGGLPKTRAVSGKFAIVSLENSYFGAGWWLAGMERLVEIVDPDQEFMWIGGDGSVRHYTPSGVLNKWVAANVDRPDTLVRNGSYFERKLPDGTAVRFNADGQHVASINSLGHTTSFHYDILHRVTHITLPVVSGTLPCYQFSYHATTWKLVSITSPNVGALDCQDPNRRLTTFWRSGASGVQLDSIGDPGGGKVRFGYSGGRMTSRTNRRNHTTSYQYLASYGYRLRRVQVDPTGLTLTTHFTPAEQRGLAGSGVSASVALTSAYSSMDGPRSDVSDSTLFWIDRFGSVAKVRNAILQTTTFTRGNAVYPALVTAIDYPNGYREESEYDERGNVRFFKQMNPLDDGQNATTEYKYYSTGVLRDYVQLAISPERDTTRYNHYSNGNLQWQQPGSDSSRRWSYRYNSANLLWRAFAPGVSDPETFTYDSRGNVARVTTARGITTTYWKDSLGRDTLVTSPIGDAGPLSVAIEGPTVAPQHANEMCSWRAVVTGGDGSPSYVWKKDGVVQPHQDIYWWGDTGTRDFWLEVHVTDTTGSASNYFHVSVTTDPVGNCL